MSRLNNNGFTLIEIAIVLTIVGLIIGGIWLAAATVFNNFKMQAMNKDAIQMIQNTKRLFSGQGASAVTNGFTMQSALASGIFPPEMISSASTAANPIIVTPFSTDQTINAVWVSGYVGNNTLLTFTFGASTAAGNGTQGLPASACTQLLITLGSLNNMQKYGVFVIGNANYTPDLSTNGTVAITPSVAAAACNHAGNTNYPAVTFSII